MLSVNTLTPLQTSVSTDCASALSNFTVYFKPDCAVLQCCNLACPEQQRKGLLQLPEIYLMLQELLKSNDLNVRVMSSMCQG